jgi:hypothetical protein
LAEPKPGCFDEGETVTKPGSLSPALPNLKPIAPAGSGRASFGLAASSWRRRMLSIQRTASRSFAVSRNSLTRVSLPRSILSCGSSSSQDRPSLLLRRAADRVEQRLPPRLEPNLLERAARGVSLGPAVPQLGDEPIRRAGLDGHVDGEIVEVAPVADRGRPQLEDAEPSAALGDPAGAVLAVGHADIGDDYQRTVFARLQELRDLAGRLEGVEQPRFRPALLGDGRTGDERGQHDQPEERLDAGEAVGDNHGGAFGGEGWRSTLVVGARRCEGSPSRLATPSP